MNLNIDWSCRFTEVNSPCLRTNTWKIAEDTVHVPFWSSSL